MPTAASRGGATVRYTAEDVAMVRGCLRQKRREREKELAQRREDALAAARQAAELLRQRGAKRVWLFGSLAGSRTFWEHSDIDLAVEGLPPQENYWQLYAELMKAAGPFNLDLVLLEEAPPDLQKAILTEGKEL